MPGEDLLKPVAALTESLRKLISPFSDPVMKELGEYVAGRIRFIHFKRSLRVLQEAKELLDSVGIIPRTVDLKVLVPILEGAGLEESDELTEMWAGLLASAASDTRVLPSFAHILSELSPQEARILEYIFLHRKGLHYETELGVEKQELERGIGLPVDEYAVRIQNLRRLGLIDQVSSNGMFWKRGMSDWASGGHVGLTALGEALISACKGPLRKADV